MLAPSVSDEKVQIFVQLAESVFARCGYPQRLVRLSRMTETAMGYFQEAAALRRSAEKARVQMDASWDEGARARFETIAMDLDREAAAIERSTARDRNAGVSI